MPDETPKVWLSVDNDRVVEHAKTLVFSSKIPIMG